MASRKLLLRAARLLKREAKVIRESCEGADHSLWVCGSCTRDKKGRCQQQIDHDQMASTAQALREAA